MKRSATDMCNEARRKVVELSVDDVRTVRNTIGMQRNARRGYGHALSVSKSGFDSLVNVLMADEFRRLEAERHGQWRYAAVIGDTAKYERPADDADSASCLICFDGALDDKAVVVPCGHRFCCASCLIRAKSFDACAICRAPIAHFGAAGDVDQVFDAGVDVGAPLTVVQFTVRGDATRLFVDKVSMILKEDDVRDVLKAYITGKDGTQDDDATWAPVSVSDLAAHSPSLFWSLHALATMPSNNGGAAEADKSVEIFMMQTQCRLLGVTYSARSGGRRRRPGAQ